MSTVVTVNIRNIAVGGAGVGEVLSQDDGNSELLGITAFVPFSVVGEVVSARVTELKPRYLNGELVEIERSSPFRTTPECQYFTNCGGCELQHIAYQGQINSKSEMIRSAMQAGRLPSDAIERLERVRPGEPYGYRRRVTLHVDISGKVGFYRESSRSVVAITHCSVAVSSINEALTSIQDFGRLIAGKVSSILLEADEKGVVAVLKSPYDLGSTERQVVLDAAKKFFINVVLMIGDKEVGGFGRQILDLPLNSRGTMTLQVPAGYFTQVNWGINRELIAEAVQWSGLKFGMRALDLYAGAGNFSLPLAQTGAKVTAVECDTRLASFGRQNAERAGVERSLNFVEASVEKFIASSDGSKYYDCIIADPPRSGLGKLVNQVGNAGRLLLISCHLPSFVRDLKALTALGWKVETIQPFDMFAQTSYVEILGVLGR